MGRAATDPYAEPDATRTDHVEDVAATRQRLQRLAWLLDSSISIPGTGRRIGLDGLIGLAPGIGDLAGALLSSYIVAQAARLRVPWSVLARMGANVAVEALVGVVPLFGDLFDFAWKANERNVRLLTDYIDRPLAVRRQSRLRMAVVFLVLVACLVGFAVAVWWLVGLVAGLFRG